MTVRSGPREAWAAVGRQARATPSVVAYVAVAGLLGTLPGLAVPMLVRVFLDEYLVQDAAQWARPVVAGLVLAAALAAVVALLQWRVLIRLALRLSAASSTRYVWHALRIPSESLRSFGSGDVTARAAGLQRQAFQGGLLLPMAAVNVITLAVYCAALIVLDATLGVASLVVVMASMTVSVRLLRGRRSLQQASDAGRVGLAAETTDLVASIESVKASAAEQWVFARWALARARAGGEVSRLSVDGQRLGMLPPLTQTVGLAVVLALGAVLVLRGSTSLGTLVAVQALLAVALVPASQLVWMGVLLAGVASTQRQADEVRTVPLDPEVRPEPVPARGPGGDGADATGRPLALDLRGVVFGYDERGAPLLGGLDVAVPAGAWVALVGGSGSGKSTIARLVVGELQPWSGTVELDGRPRLQVPRAERTRRVGYVPQYPVLMPGTIADNVTMFDPTVPLAEVRRALADACILDAVELRPRGVFDEVGPSGHGFSGGELQRLAVARAIVRHPDLLVLDEATSALDPLVEADLIDRLRALGCTCLVVAHRLSTVRDADEILVVDGGRVVQQGEFAALAHAGRFSELAHG